MVSEKKEKVKIEFFFSKTCQYCPVASKIIQEARKDYIKELDLYQIDIDTAGGQTHAQLYNVQGTPTIAINGLVIFRGVPPSQNAFNQEIEKHLSKESIERARRIHKQRRERINLMYG